MTDAPVRVRIGEEDVIVHTEFQTETSQVPMELRLAEYVGLLIREYRIPVYVTVIYLGESAGINDPGGYQYAFDNIFSYSLRYQVIRFPEIDGQEILDRNGPIGLLPFSALMKMPEGVTKEEWLKRCMQTVLTVEMTPEKKKEYVGSFFVLSSLIHDTDLIMFLIKEVGIMIDLEDFPLIREFAKKAREEARAEGLAEGLAEGRAEGLVEGRAEGRADDLTKIIGIRFGQTGVQKLEERIRAIRDEQILSTLIESALTSSSLEAFQKALANQR
jgi:predicted transposase YdaD